MGDGWTYGKILAGWIDGGRWMSGWVDRWEDTGWPDGWVDGQDS